LGGRCYCGEAAGSGFLEGESMQALTAEPEAESGGHAAWTESVFVCRKGCCQYLFDASILINSNLR